MLLALLAVTMFTACGDDDEPVNKQTATMLINSRTIVKDSVAQFLQSAAKVELDYTNMFIKFTADFKDANGMTHTFTTSDMKMYTQSGTVYSFNNMASDTYAGFDQFVGYIDMASGVVWYSFDVDSVHVVSTSQLLYAYTTTTITNPDNGNHISHEQSAYLFALDSKGETCVMKISNFVDNVYGNIQAPEVQYNGLTVERTATGYIITADEVESSYKGYYTLTDLNITLDSQCQVIGGSFKCGDLDYTISGKLFPLNNM